MSPRRFLPEASVDGAVMTVRVAVPTRRAARGLALLAGALSGFYFVAVCGLCVLFATVGEAEPTAFVVLALFAMVGIAVPLGAFLFDRRIHREVVIDRAAGVVRHRGGTASLAEVAAVRVRKQWNRWRVELVGSEESVVAVATDAVPYNFEATATDLARQIGTFVGLPVRLS